MPSSSSSGRRNWRDADGRRGKRRTSSRKTGKWWFSLLALLLVAALVWQLYPRQRTSTHLVALSIHDYDRVDVPRLSYSQEDITFLDDSFAGQIAQLSDLDKSSSISNLSGRLRESAAQSADVLILYVSAHGVSGYGEIPSATAPRESAPPRQAYLLCTDYRPGGIRGRYLAADLLDAVRKCGAKLKLIVLDSGRIDIDPRHGMMINEFSELLEADVKATQDVTLWVLSSHGLLESNNVLPRHTQSLFGLAVGESLKGPDHSELTLAQFYGGVMSRTRAWFRSTNGELQTPILINGDRGVVAPDDKEIETLVVRRIGKTRGSNDEAGGAARQTKSLGRHLAAARPHSPRMLVHALAQAPLGGRPPETAASESRPVAKPAPKDDKPTTTKNASPVEPARSRAGENEEKEKLAAPPAGGKKEPPKAIEKVSDEIPPLPVAWQPMLHHAWQLRDQIQARKVSAAYGWSPVDFAPHLWRRLDAELLAYENWYYSQTTRGTEADKLELQQLHLLIGRLEQLHAYIQGNGQPVRRPPGDIGEGLIQAWRQLVEEDASVFSNWNDVDPSRYELRRDLRVRADLNYVAPYYVAWYDRASLTSARDIGAYPYLCDFLDALARLNQMSVDEPRGTGDAPSQAFLSAVGRVKNLRVKVDAQMKSEQEHAILQLADADNRRRVLQLLATPLLSGELRTELRKQLTVGDAVLPGVSDREFDGQTGPGPQQWDRAAQRAQLHQKLVNLFDRRRASLIQNAIPKGGSQDQDVLLERHAHVGLLIRYAYDAMVGDLISPKGSAPRQALLARLMDHRDVQRLSEKDALPRFVAKFPIKPPRLTLQLAGSVEAGGSLELTRAGVPLELRLVPSTRLDNVNQRVELRLDYDKKNLDVYALVGGDRIRLESMQRSGPLSIRFGASNPGRIDLRVVAKHDRTDATSGYRLTIQAALGPVASNRYAISCRLPYPDRIDLSFRRPGTKTAVGNSARPGLRPFPNRTTRYDVLLTNHSGRPRKVLVQFMAARRPSRATWPPGRMHFSGDRHVLKAVKGATEPLTQRPVLVEGIVELPATVVPTPVKLAAPAPKTAKPPAGAAPAAKPPAAKPHRVTDGLVCVLTDLNEKTKQPSRWIELRPLAPSDYVRVESEFDENQRSVLVRASLKANGDPGVTSDALLLTAQELDAAPLSIKWHTNGEFKGLDIQDRGGISPTDREASLRAEINPEHEEAPKRDYRVVVLTVDGYPRAFVHKVYIRGGGATESMKEGLRRIRFSKMRMADFSRAYLPMKKSDQDWSGGVTIKQDPAAADDPEKKIEIVDLPQDRAAAFPVKPDETKTIRAELQVDAPNTAFQLRRAGGQADQIVIRSGPKVLKRLYADRDSNVDLLVDPGGRLVLKTEVADHSYNYQPNGQGRRELTAELHAGGQEKIDRVALSLDQVGPDIRVSDASARVGETLKVRVHVKDLSGVRRVVFALDANNNRAPDKKEQNDQHFENLIKNGNVELELKTGKLEPGSYRLFVEAVDDVGHASKWEVATITLRAALLGGSGAKRGPKAPTTGIIRGFIYKGKTSNRPDSKGQFTVTIVELGISTGTDRAGEFLFEKVPAGASYTLTAFGSLNNHDQKGKISGVRPWSPQVDTKRPFPVNPKR